MVNRRGVSYHIDSQWQVSCSILWKFVAPNSNAIIFKTENFFIFFCSIPGICIKFWRFWKKIWSSWLLYLGNYRLWKTWIEEPLKKHRFRTPLSSQHVKRSQTLGKSAWDHFHHILPLSLENMIWEIFSFRDMLNLRGVS